MKIGLQLEWLNDGTVANFVGDAGMADGWKKYLLRRDDVTRVDIIGGRRPMAPDLDVVIHFLPWLPLHPTAKNVAYCQYGAPRGPQYPGGTVGLFFMHKSRFIGHMFTSETLRKACATDGAVIPFAVDPEVMFYQPDERFAHPVSFVGSDIRGDEANERYIAPALAHGLVIYGGPWNAPKFQAVHRGRASADDLPRIYSSSRVNLNVHMPIHSEYGTVNQRIFEVLACGGVCLTDYHEGIRALDGHVMVMLDNSVGDNMESVVIFNTDRNYPRDDCRDFILARHTFKHRTDAVMRYLKEIV